MSHNGKLGMLALAKCELVEAQAGREYPIAEPARNDPDSLYPGLYQTRSIGLEEWAGRLFPADLDGVIMTMMTDTVLLEDYMLFCAN